MQIPYSLVIIKPMTVGRGSAPDILESILNDCPVSLRMFRQFVVCSTTLAALTTETKEVVSNLNYDDEVIHASRGVPSWICLFTHKDRLTDPTLLLEEYFGPLDPNKWRDGHLRYKYGGFGFIGKTAHSSDTALHLSKAERVNYESTILFTNFDETLL
jgi:hypothetical protein